MTITYRCFLSILMLLSLGCQRLEQQSVDAEEHGLAHANSCMYLGNVPGEHYCTTTYTQILAHPSAYAGKKIKVLVWARPGSAGKIYLYPSPGSLQNGEYAAAIVMVDPLKFNEVQEFLVKANAVGDPVSFYVVGTFASRSSDARMSSGVNFGTLTEVEEFGK